MVINSKTLTWNFHFDLKSILLSFFTEHWSHPQSVDASNDDTAVDRIALTSQETDLGASVVIGALLVVPVLIIVCIVVVMRMRKQCKYCGPGGYHTGRDCREIPNTPEYRTCT